MKDSGQDKQAAQPKNDAAIQDHGEANLNSPTDQTETLEQDSKIAKKIKKMKIHKDRQEYQEKSTLATKNNTKLFSHKKQKDISHITCFSCNKKGYYLKDCAEPKAKN